MFGRPSQAPPAPVNTQSMILHPSVPAVADRLAAVQKLLARGRILTKQDADVLREHFATPYGGPGDNRLALGHGGGAEPEAAGEFEDPYTIPATLSVLEEDRDGDIVFPRGCQTGPYQRNPVVFFGHQQWEIPVGVSTNKARTRLYVWPGEREIRGACRFDEHDEDAMFVHDKVLRGFINGTSIAFVPIEAWRRERGGLEERGLGYEDDKARTHADRQGIPLGWFFKEYELTEWSWVGVQSNRGAGALRDALDREKNFISPRLQKGLSYYAAQPRGVWRGWCPPGTACDGKGGCAPVNKGLRAAVSKQETEAEESGEEVTNPVEQDEEEKGRGSIAAHATTTGYEVGQTVYARTNLAAPAVGGSPRVEVLARAGDRLQITGREGPQWQVFNPKTGKYGYVGPAEVRRAAPMGTKKQACGCHDCKSGKACPCKGGAKQAPRRKAPSDDVPPGKACQILEDGEANGKPLTEARRGMFGVACGRAKSPAPGGEQKKGVDYDKVRRDIQVPGVTLEEYSHSQYGGQGGYALRRNGSYFYDVPRDIVHRLEAEGLLGLGGKWTGKKSAKQLSEASGPAGGYVVAVDGDPGQFPGGEEVHEDDVEGGKAQCPDCLGTGNCSACEGKGEATEGEECEECGGSGDCPECKGQGFIDKEPEQFTQAPEEGEKMASKNTRKGKAPAKQPARKQPAKAPRKDVVHKGPVLTYSDDSTMGGRLVRVQDNKVLESAFPAEVPVGSEYNSNKWAQARLRVVRDREPPGGGGRSRINWRRAAPAGVNKAADEELEVEDPDDLLDQDEDSLSDESEKDISPEEEPDRFLDTDEDETYDADEKALGAEEPLEEPFIPKHSARVITTAYAHAKGEDDYLQDETAAMDNPDAAKALQRYHAKFVQPRMEHLKGLLHEHHGNDEQHAGLGPDELLDKHLKALEAEQAGALEREPVGEDNAVGRGDLPPDAVAGDDVDLDGDVDLPPEGEMLGKDEGPGGDADTEEILERYRDKAGRWHTRKVGTLRRTKDGRAFIVRKGGGSAAVQQAMADGMTQWKAPSGGWFHLDKLDARLSLSAAYKQSSYDSSSGYISAVATDGTRHKWEVKSIQKSPVDEPFDPDGGRERADLDELNKAVGDAEEYLGEMAEDDDLPRKHKAPVRYHAKRLGQVRKGLTDMGKVQRDGGPGKELDDEGTAGNKGSLKDDTGWNRPGKGPSGSTATPPPEGEKGLQKAFVITNSRGQYWNQDDAGWVSSRLEATEYGSQQEAERNKPNAVETGAAGAKVESKSPGERRLSPAVAHRFDVFVSNLKGMGLDLGN